jgi:hypothetical protein
VGAAKDASNHLLTEAENGASESDLAL